MSLVAWERGGVVLMSCRCGSVLERCGCEAALNERHGGGSDSWEEWDCVSREV